MQTNKESAPLRRVTASSTNNFLDISALQQDYGASCFGYYGLGESCELSVRLAQVQERNLVIIVVNYLSIELECSMLVDKLICLTAWQHYTRQVKMWGQNTKC